MGANVASLRLRLQFWKSSPPCPVIDVLDFEILFQEVIQLDVQQIWGERKGPIEIDRPNETS